MTGAISLFFSAFLAATLLPGASEALLVALLLTGEYDTWLLLLGATTGNVLGSVVNWLLGRFFMHFQDRRWFPVSPRQVRKAEIWYSKFGVWSLLLAWAPIIGDPLTLIAGMLGVRFPTFIILVTIGKSARYLVVAATTLAWI